MWIKDMPAPTRPRERLAAYGVKRLSDEELIAILLRVGTKEQSVMEVSRSLLYSLSQLGELGEKTFAELTQFSGIGPTKAGILLCALELGRRVFTNRASGKEIKQPEDVGELLRAELAGQKQEHLIALYLDLKGKLIAKETLFVGGLNQSVVHPREVFKYAVKWSAYQIVLAHNHPSGDATPSQADIEMTMAFQLAGEMMQIPIADHVIVTERECRSVLGNKKRRI